MAVSLRGKSGSVNSCLRLDGGCPSDGIKCWHERSPIFHAAGRLSAAPNTGRQPVPQV
jgi:hypothetical protein